MTDKPNTNIKERAEEVFINSFISLTELADSSKEILGRKVPLETIRKWARDFKWYNKRSQVGSKCPNCGHDLSSESGIDVKIIYQNMIALIYDQVMEKPNANLINQLRSLIKEAGFSPTDVTMTSAKSDLDQVLEEYMSRGKTAGG